MLWIQMIMMIQNLNSQKKIANNFHNIKIILLLNNNKKTTINKKKRILNLKNFKINKKLKIKLQKNLMKKLILKKN